MSTKLKSKVLKDLSSKIKSPNLNRIYSLIFNAVFSNNQKELEYKNIVSFRRFKDEKQPFNKKQFDELLELIYSFWWNEYLVKEYNKHDKYSFKREAIKNLFIDNPKINIDSKKRYNIEYLIKKINESDKITYNFPVNFQSTYFCQFFISSYKKPEDFRNFNVFDMRLYLETDIKNMPVLATEFTNYMIKNNLTFPFKCALTNRNDSFVFYVTYENLKNAINMIESVKEKKPELFKNCRITNPLLASYDGFIGLGEEPYAFDSYNNIRSTIMLNTFKELRKQFKQNPRNLTYQNIEKVFKEQCIKEYVNPEEFYLNKKPYEEEDVLTLNK